MKRREREIWKGRGVSLALWEGGIDVSLQRKHWKGFYYSSSYSVTEIDAAHFRVYLPIGWVSHVTVTKKVKRIKEREMLRDSL
jgi:hypothetical protein